MRRALLALTLLTGCKGPARAPARLPEPEACVGVRLSDPQAKRLPCAWELARRSCAAGHAPSCDLKARVERRLLELAAGGCDD